MKRVVVVFAAGSLAWGTAVAPGTSQAAPQAYRETIPGTLVAFEMVPVPGGTVMVEGNPVTIAPFYIGRTEATWDMYDVFALGLDSPKDRGGADAVARPSQPYGAPDYGWGHAGYPAISIARAAADAYCDWLTQKTGQRYRLPTESEWLHAAALAAGSKPLTPERLETMTWHRGNAEARTHPVGTKRADALGLFDLFGKRGRMGHDERWQSRYEGRLLPRCGGGGRPGRARPAARRLERARPAGPEEPLVALGCAVRRIPGRSGNAIGPGTSTRHPAPGTRHEARQGDSEMHTITRRTFIHTTATATAAFAFHGGVHAAGSDVIRVGLVGCGGRGTGAVRDCLVGSEGMELVALGDLFPDRLGQCREQLAKLGSENPVIAAGNKVTDERCFTGFDAYEKVLASDIQLVILATPPGFRPAHLAAAVASGKHIFTEKPVAVDAAGIRSVLATYELARQKGLGIGVGTQRRHQPEYLETIRRIRDGAIGDVLSGQVFWNQGGLWNHERLPAWSDTEWQIRNWLYFTWLSGDHIVEQHVHNIDVANWVLDAHPVKASGVGGRQWRVDRKYGHIYDHFGVDFEYPGGARVMSMCRQIQGTRGRVEEQFIGTRGTATAGGRIDGANAWSWEHPEQRVNPYVQEHTDLVASLRSGKPYNLLKQVAESTLTAILGREAAYTGQEIAWDEMLNADQDLTPPQLALGPLEIPPVAMPGMTTVNRKWSAAAEPQR